MIDPEKVSSYHINLLINYLELFHNDTKDFQVPHLRRSVRYVYPLFVFLYALIIIVGTASNACVVLTILRRHMYRDPTFYFVCNLALSDMIKCLFVLPVTLANLLILNWLFGSFLCYFLPMMQYIPIHASMLTFLLIAVDRYRLVLFPLSARVPRFICVLGIWILSICVVLPFAIYITYFDLGAMFGPGMRGTGLCTVNIEDDMEEYLRGLFIVMYVLPLALVAFLHVRVSGEIKCREHPPSTVVFEISSADERSRSSWAEAEETREARSEQALDGDPGVRWHRQVPEEDGFDPAREKRTQRYLVTMITLFAMCLCPLEIMKLVKHIVAETYDNTGHFDLAYIIFVWIGFLPTCITPILFASWMMSRPAKERLKGYFRLSNRRRRSGSDAEFRGRRTRTEENGGRCNEGFVPAGAKGTNAAGTHIHVHLPSCTFDGGKDKENKGQEQRRKSCV